MMIYIQFRWDTRPFHSISKARCEGGQVFASSPKWAAQRDWFASSPKWAAQRDWSKI